MLPFSKILMGSFSVLGSGGIGLWGTYEFSKLTFFDGLNGKKIPLGNEGVSNDAWKKLLVKWKDNSKESKLKTKSFEKFESETDLKDHCEKTGKEIYSTIFKTNKDLLDDFESSCTITIEEVAEKKNLLKATEGDQTDKEEFQKNLKNLKEHGDTGKKGELVKSLLKIKEIISGKDKNEDKDWEKLAKWCRDSYKLTFIKEDESVWKQVIKYCKKQQQ